MPIKLNNCGNFIIVIGLIETLISITYNRSNNYFKNKFKEKK